MLQKAKPPGDYRGFAGLEGRKKDSGARDTEKDLESVWTCGSASLGQRTKQERPVVSSIYKLKSVEEGEGGREARGRGKEKLTQSYKLKIPWRRELSNNAIR